MPKEFQDYWDRNIDLWGEKYLDISHGHETFNRPAWFTALYNATAGRLERRLMKERYRRTIAFIDAHMKPGTVFSDLGCGTGIFVVEAARRGAIVNAVDFSESSLTATRRNVEANVPDAKISYIHVDLQTADLPQSDVTLAMGVTPYLKSAEQFIGNALPRTSVMCCQFTDPHHWANVVRRAVPVLDVRSLQCHSRAEVDCAYDKHGGLLSDRRKFASGFIDVVINQDRLPCGQRIPPFGLLTL